MNGTKGWRASGLTGGFLATVVLVLAVAAPWFEKTDPTGSETYTPWPWGDPNAASAPDTPFLSMQLTELMIRQEWGLLFVIAAASGALISFIAAAKRPDAERVGRAVTVNLVAAVVCLVMTVLMWASFGAGGGDETTTAVMYGFVVAVPAQLAWLGAAITQTRLWSRSRQPVQTATA